MAGFTAAEATAVIKHVGQESEQTSRGLVEGNSVLLSEYLENSGLENILGMRSWKSRGRSLHEISWLAERMASWAGMSTSSFCQIPLWPMRGGLKCEPESLLGVGLGGAPGERPEAIQSTYTVGADLNVQPGSGRQCNRNMLQAHASSSE